MPKRLAAPRRDIPPSTAGYHPAAQIVALSGTYMGTMSVPHFAC